MQKLYKYCAHYCSHGLKNIFIFLLYHLKTVMTPFHGTKIKVLVQATASPKTKNKKNPNKIPTLKQKVAS